MSINFNWFEEKAISNLKKHRVSFEEAVTVFDDPLSITIEDNEHSILEERYIDIGLSNKNRILTVIYTEFGNTIRIISSRLATKKEIMEYEK